MNLPTLVSCIGAALAGHDISYEIIVVDDRSMDETIAVLDELAGRFPVHRLAKRGPQGKGYSLLEGFGRARGAMVCMIDADLQYPPESIIAMMGRVLSGDADLVVANRRVHPTRPLRRLASLCWKLLSRSLHGLDVDTQAGLKVMRAEVLERLALRPSAWAVDLELLVKARAAGYRIVGHDIEFRPRSGGHSKMRLSVATYQLLAGAVRLRLAGDNRVGQPAAANSGAR